MSPAWPQHVTGPLRTVLTAMLAAGGAERHGWALVQTTCLTGATVYRVLRRLSEAGWASTRCEPTSLVPSLPPRRYYRLTDEGTERALELLARRRPR